jgi:ATP/maltotriose-dependent transcriptional regulator MalT
LADELEAMLAANPGLQALILLRGLIAVDAGRREEARQVLERAAEERYPFPFDRTQAFLLSRCAELAMKLNAGVRFAELYDRLLPYREQFATPGGISSRGSVALVLGRLASRRGRFATAHQHLDAAERAHDRLKAPLFQARTSLARAECLLDEGGRQNARRAMELLDIVLVLAREHGSAAIEREVHALQTRLHT